MPFIVDSLENLVCSFVERFILPDVLKKATTTHNLSQLVMTDPKTQMRIYEVGFSIDHDLCHLERKKKITDSYVNTFKKKAKQSVSTLCKHILSMSPLTSCFVRAAQCLNSIILTEIPDTCEKQVHNILQNLLMES